VNRHGNADGGECSVPPEVIDHVGSSARGRSNSPARVWGWPIALAALTIFGLLAALLGQGGLWWVLSWIALGTPLVIALSHLRHKPRARDPGDP
jgi:hypothetical protein